MNKKKKKKKKKSKLKWKEEKGIKILQTDHIPNTSF